MIILTKKTTYLFLTDPSLHLISSVCGFKTTQHTARAKAINEKDKQLSFAFFGMAFMMIFLMLTKLLLSVSQIFEYASITQEDFFHSPIFEPAFDLISGIFITLNNADFISFDNES